MGIEYPLRLGNGQHNLMHVYTELSPIIINWAYCKYVCIGVQPENVAHGHLFPIPIQIFVLCPFKKQTIAVA